MIMEASPKCNCPPGDNTLMTIGRVQITCFCIRLGFSNIYLKSMGSNRARISFLRQNESSLKKAESATSPVFSRFFQIYSNLCIILTNQNQSTSLIYACLRKTIAGVCWWRLSMSNMDYLPYAAKKARDGKDEKKRELMILDSTIFMTTTSTSRRKDHSCLPKAE